MKFSDLSFRAYIDENWSQIDANLTDDIGSYIHQYGFGIIGWSLLCLEQAQLGQDRGVWSKEWAVRLSQDDPQAWQHNADRKLCLTFLYKIIDSGLLHAFRPFRVERIVRLCLPMERANAMYNMINHKTNTRGLYWFAEADRFWMQSLLTNQSDMELLQNSRAPLNRRLRGLLDVEELGYRDDEEIRGWMRPQKPN